MDGANRHSAPGDRVEQVLVIQKLFSALFMASTTAARRKRGEETAEMQKPNGGPVGLCYRYK
jgi:hypothetical protein